MPIPAIIGAVAATSVAIGGAVAAKKRSDKEAELLKGASGGQILAAARTQTAADRLASGSGLSDTEYSRGVETAQAISAGEAAGVTEAIREAPQLSSAAADVIVKKAFARGSANVKAAADKLTLAGINKAERNLQASISASASAGQQESAIQALEIAKQKQQLKTKAEGAKNFVNIIGTAGKSVSNIMTAYNKGNLTEAGDTSQATGREPIPNETPAAVVDAAAFTGTENYGENAPKVNYGLNFIESSFVDIYDDDFSYGDY